MDHNKLRFYRTFKSSFTIEPYIQLITNRNQRTSITRLRTSAHRLQVELGRYTVPKTPFKDRVCKYCSDHQDTGDLRDSCVDDDFHFLMNCVTFNTKRNCLFGKISSIEHNFAKLSEKQKMVTLLCPTNIKIAKLVNKFIYIVVEARKRIDSGEILNMSHFTDPPTNCSLFSDSNIDD